MDEFDDEYPFNIYDISDRSWFWKKKVQLKKIIERLILKDNLKQDTRYFLHLDIKETRHIRQFKQKTMPLRYVDEDGQLFVSTFKVRIGCSNIIIKQIPGRTPLPGKFPKGPVTLKPANCFKKSLSLRGIVSQWNLPFNKIL